MIAFLGGSTTGCKTWPRCGSPWRCATPGPCFPSSNAWAYAPEHYLDHWLAHQHVLAYIASDFYDNAIFGVTLGLAAWTWWRRPDIYRPLRNDLVLANLIGFAVFWLYPLAPPRMLPGFVDVVEKVGGLGSWHNLLISHADQLAAMPSMHLAWAVWCSLVVWRLARARPAWRWAAGRLRRRSTP